MAFPRPAAAYSMHANDFDIFDEHRLDVFQEATAQGNLLREEASQQELDDDAASRGRVSQVEASQDRATEDRGNQAKLGWDVVSDPDNKRLASCSFNPASKDCPKEGRSPSNSFHGYVTDETPQEPDFYAQIPGFDADGNLDEPTNGQLEPPPGSTLDPETNPAVDPDLGILRLIELPVESVEILDPELGVLRLQELPLAADSSDPSVYLQVYSNFFWTDNVLSVVDDPVDDGILQLGVSLSAIPALGDRTYLISSASGDLVRYTDETNLDYNDIAFNLGVYHAFTRRAYLEVGWNNDQFFDRRTGDRFLNDHGFYVSVGRRDRLSSRLRLDTEYELEYNLSDPVERNRAINQLRASLEYQVTPKLETDLSYRLNLIDFTKQDRNDFYHQIVLGVNYDLSRDTQLSFFGGGRLGDSSESFLDFNSALVGVSISVNLPLF